MNREELRRSQRVVVSLPITLSGVDKTGRQFSEETRTLVVNRNGAMILCSHELAPGSEVELAAFQATARSRARVVRVAGQHKESGGWAVAAELAEPGNFWKINFPPQEATDLPSQAGRMQENLAGLRPRPVMPPIPRVRPPNFDQEWPARKNNSSLAPGKEACASPTGGTEADSKALKAVEAAVMSYASESLLSRPSPDEMLKRYQLITGALLRALMRRGLLTGKELRDALEKVQSDLGPEPIRTKH